MNKRKKLGRKLLSFLLTLAMVVGMMPGMGLTAYAEGSSTSTLTFTRKCNGSGTADDNVAWTVTSDAEESYFDNSKGIHYGSSNKAVQYIRLSTSGITGTITKVVVNASYGGTNSDGNTVGVTVGGTAFGGDPKTIGSKAADYTFTGSGSGEIIVTVSRPEAAKKALYVKSIAVTYSTSPTVDVTDVTLNKTSATLAVGGTETLTATVAPDDATDKTVKWSVGGTNSGAVKLYTDADCTTEVGADATETLTVYAKGISAGSATVTATSNADNTKSASCDVTVNEATAQYYVVGSMNGWSVEDSYLMTYDQANAEFQLLGVSLSDNDEIKVVKNEDSFLTWYPEGMDNGYTITAGGTYNIHFRPDGQGGDGWHKGYIMVEAASAATYYASYVNTTTVTFNNIDWYIIADDSTAVDAGTVTLLAKDPISASKFHDSSNAYSSSTVKTYLDSLTATGGSFEAVADAITSVTLTIYKYGSTTEVAETIQNAKLWLLSTSEAQNLPENIRKCSKASGADNNHWWLSSPGDDAEYAACVRGDNGEVFGNGQYVGDKRGVRPALKLNLESVIFSSNTFTVGTATVDVTGVSLDKTTAQTIDVDAKVSFTATVAPDNATDKTVKWSVGGTNAGAVKLYTDADCTTEVGTDATETLTVYAKGISAGSATVTATSNADSEKKASCDVTVNAAAHTHNDITFTAWTSNDSLPTAAGSYYLANDVTLGSLWNVPEGTTNLCLNGHAIKSTGDHRMMEVGAGVTLSLYDEGAGVHKYTLNGDGLAVVDDNATGENVKTFEGGYLTGAYASNLTGACVLVKDGGIFNMHGGTMIGNYAAKYAFGGAVSVQASRFEMTGGKMIGNVSLHGAVDTRGGGDGFIMKGGEISYNTASNQGGAVCMGGGGIATISGGKITNNIALGNPDGSSESGGIVFRSGASALNISGNPIIKDNVGGDVYLWSGKKINVVGELTNEASIGITIKPATGTSGYASGVFTNSSDTSFNIVGAFFSNSQDYAVGKNADGQLFLGSPIVTLTYDGNGATGGNVPAETTGYASGSAITVPGNTNSLVKTGLVFDGWNTMADGSGTAYAADQAFTITANTTLYAQWKIVHVHDDISFTAWTDTNSMPTKAGNYFLANDVTLGSLWNVPEGTTNLCLNGHGIIMSGTNRVITVSSGSTLNLYDCGTEAVHKFTVTNPSTGGAGLAKVNDGLESGYQTFTGGYITGGQGGRGGGVYIAGGTFNMHGGNIIGNHAQGSMYYDGGGVALSRNVNSRFAMTGGAIQYNTSVGRGGGLGIDNNATAELSGDAKITYNSCNDWGGGISSFGALSISGNVKITNNKGGSALHPQQGSLTISGAPVIFDNEVTANILPDVKINVTGTLTEGAKLGIYLGNGGVFTDSSDTSYNDASKFVSDNPDYSVMKNADGQLCLAAIYTVTFNAGEHGTAPDAQRVVSGSKLTKPTDPTAEGYAFDGWYKEEALTNEWDFDSDTVTGNITLYAKWRQAISYTVTFKVVNGSWDDETTTDKTVTLNGYAGDELKLASNQIPAVGSKPSATYKAGSWNVTPSTTTVISAATTYTYTYVQKASITPTVSMDGWTYGETAKTPSVNGNTGNGAVTYTYAKKNTTSFSKTVPSDAGEYTIKAVIAETDNYMAGEATTDFTIARANATVTAPTANTLTYNGQDQTLVSGGATQDGTLQYAIGTSATIAPTTGFGTTIPSGKTAGTYYVWYKVVGDDNHNDFVATTPVTAEIAKAAITITADDKSTKYGADIAELTYVVSGAYVTGDDLGVTVSTTATNASPVNTYPISISWNNNANYSATLTNGTYTITKADLTVSASGYSGTYDGHAHGISVDVGNSGATVYYGTAELTEQNYSNAGSTTNPTYTDAGTYTVYYYVKATNYDPQPVKGSQTVTIAKKAATINANAASKTYGDADPALTATVTGTVGNDTLNYTLGRTAGENVDGYTITVTANAADNPNYDITTNNGTFTINKKALTITADSATKVYDTTALTKNGYTNTDLAAGDSIESVTITGSQTTAASSDNVPSSAVIKKGGTDVTTNYEITYVNGTLTVTQAMTNTVTVDITGWTYGDSANAPTSEADFGANTVTYSYSDAQDGTYTATVPVNAGTWYVKASVAGTANYVAGEAVKSFTIAKREVVVSGIVAVDKNYDGTNTASLDFSKASFENLVAADAGKLSVTATGTFADEKIGMDKKVTITGLTLTGEKAGNYVLAANGQQKETTADISNVIQVTDVRFIGRIKNFTDLEADVTGITLDLAKSLCTAAELAAYGAGGTLELELEISKLGNLMTEDTVSLVQNAVRRDKNVGIDWASYYDISLYKVAGGVRTKVTDLSGQKLKITMKVPAENRSTPAEVRYFYMVRVHGGAADVLAETTGYDVIFESDKFSTYALCYADEWLTASSISTTATSGTATATATGISPKTDGEEAENRILLVLGMSFAIAAIVTGIYTGKRKKEEE